MMLTDGCSLTNQKLTHKMTLKYIGSKKMENYPSGSTMSIYDKRIYVMGDDALSLVVLDDDFEMIDSIEFFKNDENRIEKAKKADIESSEWLVKNGISKLWLFGSGSLSPQRDSAFCFDPNTRKIERIDMGVFYQKIKNLGILELNIEATALIDNQLVFGSRGNLNNKQNYLILSSASAFPEPRNLKTILLDLPEKAGISGLWYLPDDDVLLMTSSEENTGNAYDDGEIGESYFGIIYQASQKMVKIRLLPDEWIKLSTLHSDLSKQKVESVSAIKSGQGYKLILISDDDQGGTKLFNLNLQIRRD